MLAMQCLAPRTRLAARTIPCPEPRDEEILIRVHACGVCRTDLHIVDGDLPLRRYPCTPGHEIVGVVTACGSRVARFAVGDRVGVPWLAGTCGICRFCRSGRENLCDAARFTGRDIDGGFAEFAIADSRYCFAIPERYSDADAAPLLCAGLIGYRALRAAGDARRIGLYGFGAAAHIVAQVAVFEGREVFAFTRIGDTRSQAFARSKGAVWAGDSEQRCPVSLDAAIIFAPVGALVPAALESVTKGGSVVCAGIHMSEIPAFAYANLWGERAIKSVANLTRRDGEEFLALAPQVPVRTDTRCYALADANTALDHLRSGDLTGAAVLLTTSARPGNQ